MKINFFVLAVFVLMLLGTNVQAQAYHIPDTGDPDEQVCNPKSYTDLGNGIVRDNVTGLEWQQATSSSVGNGWRLPESRELLTILDGSSCYPSIDTDYFPDTMNAPYRTNNLFLWWYDRMTSGYLALGLDFGTGAFLSFSVSWPDYYVRAVRGQLPASSFVDNDDGTVTDTSTGLMWQQTISSPELNFEEAKQYCASLSLADYSDWRMPTKNELYTLIDFDSCYPYGYSPGWSPTSPELCMDDIFLNYDTAQEVYEVKNIWSSTTCASDDSDAWAFDFAYPFEPMACIDKQEVLTYFQPKVRAVRGGSCRADGDWCIDDNDCTEGSVCIESTCDAKPSTGPGPFLAAGTWPLLSTSVESPMYLDANYDVLWTFSDDYGSCSEDCTHSAEYQAVGGSEWTALAVTATANGYAYATLPIESLQNATTYGFRYSVTDCASQTTQSAVYYFRVATSDAPPVITSGPFLAAGAWPVLATSSSRATVLDQNEYVLWTFSDDYAFCSGLCTHRARYRKVGDTVWTWIPVSADPTGRKYAYTELPVAGLAAGTYQFYFDVRDCEGQRTSAPKIYYFKVE